MSTASLLPAAFAALVAAALLLPAGADRCRGALGLPAWMLGVASLPYLPDFRGPSLTVWISAALLLLGPALLVLATWRARARLRWHHPAILVVIAAMATALVAAWPTLEKGGVLPAVLTAGAIGLGAWLDWLIGAAIGLGRFVRRTDARLGPRDASADSRTAWIAALVVVAIAVGLRALGARTPFAPEAQIWWAAAAGVLGLLAAGLWPAHRLVPGGPFALAAGALLLGLGWGSWPLGMAHWQPIGVGLGALSVLWAAPTGRTSLALAGAGVAACFSAPESAPGAAVLLAAAAVHRLPPRTLAAGGAVGLYLVMPSLLGAEVFFTVLIAWGATAMLGAGAARDAAAEPAAR